MVKKLLVILIIAELGLFWYFYSERGPKVVTDAPYKLTTNDLQKKDVSQSVFEQTRDNNQEVRANSQSSNTLTQIKDKYFSLASELEADTYSMIIALAMTAYEDYQEKGESLLALTSMTKYISEFKAMEKETDQKFDSLYTQFKEELKQNGHPTSEAETYKQIYEEKKKTQLKELLKLATQQTTITE